MQPSDHEFELPEPLRRALERHGRIEETNSAEVGELDRAVLSGVGPALARARARHLRRRISLVLLPVAAAAALLFLFQRLGPHTREMAPELRAMAEDLDRNGRVDILDAFQLARELELGNAPRGRDVNGDGRIDREDVEYIAHLAVRLGA